MQFCSDYSSVNTAHFVLSAIFPWINGMTFSRHHVIQRLLKRVFKEISYLLKYTTTYDGLQKPLSVLSKVSATLMCFLSGQLSQTLSSLNSSHMLLEKNHCLFYFQTFLKQLCPRFYKWPPECQEYTLDVSICVVRLINFIYGKLKSYDLIVSLFSFLVRWLHIKRSHQKPLHIHFKQQCLQKRQLKDCHCSPWKRCRMEQFQNICPFW